MSIELKQVVWDEGKYFFADDPDRKEIEADTIKFIWVSDQDHSVIEDEGISQSLLRREDLINKRAPRRGENAYHSGGGRVTKYGTAGPVVYLRID